MVREQHCNEAYFLSFFYTITRNNRTRNDKKIVTHSKQFRGLKEFSDYCFRNVKEIRHYYHNRQVIESDARNSFRSFISAKSDEFFKELLGFDLYIGSSLSNFQAGLR